MALKGEKKKEWSKIYAQKNKERIKEYKNEWRRTSPSGRADMLLQAYRQKDKKHNRGEGDLTARWIVENILSKPCAHCGESDWHKIGCNRLDNSKPHTMDNVEPCCLKCNNELNYEDRRNER
jgi:hypothetical protein